MYQELALADPTVEAVEEDASGRTPGVLTKTVLIPSQEQRSKSIW